MDNDEPPVSNKYSCSHSESSSQSQHDNELISRKSKRPPPLLSKKPQKSNLIQTKNSNQFDNTDYYDNSNDLWENWNESNDNRQHQSLHSDNLSTQKSNRYNKQSSIKIRHNDRQQINSRSKPTSSLSNKINQLIDNKSTNKKTQAVWRPLSPTRSSEPIDSIPQEPISYKSQQQQQINDRRQSDSYQQRTNLNDHKQRYQTTNTSMINTASIPPLMSVRSDATTTAKLYKTTNHTGSSDYYDDENVYYDSNLQTHQRYHHSNLHNRGYTTLGSYGRYKRSVPLRHQQQYTTYNINNTSTISSAPNTSSGTRQKKNSTNRTNTNNKKSNQSSEQTKTSMVDDQANSSIVKNQPIIEDVSITKPIETSVLSSTTEIEKSNPSGNGISDQKIVIKTDNESNIISQTENQSIKPNKKNPNTSANSKRRTNKDQQNYQQDQRYQNQQAPRHRNNYARSMQGIEFFSNPSIQLKKFHPTSRFLKQNS
jgi:hypothetical protein